MFLQKIKLENLLSFKDAELELRPLNVLIGPNASGKSNLIRAIGLLRSLPTDLATEIANGGGPRAWINQRARGNATVRVNGNRKPDVTSFKFEFSIAEAGQGYRIANHKLDAELASGGHVRRGRGAVVQDPRMLIPAVLKRSLESIRLYREFHTGPDSNTRRGVAASALGEFLSEDGGNLALVLSDFALQGHMPKVKQALKRLYEPFEDVLINARGGIAQLYVRETGMTEPMSALSLSDGTLRLLCLLAILLAPEPPPLICIEEPEIGLHPDAIGTVADLLREASERTQLIVTTHSPALIDALSDQPESVVVCERDFDGFTQLRRLKSAQLDEWLKDYSLGQLWQKGEIGGNRW